MSGRGIFFLIVGVFLWMCFHALLADAGMTFIQRIMPMLFAILATYSVHYSINLNQKK